MVFLILIYECGLEFARKLRMIKPGQQQNDEVSDSEERLPLFPPCAVE